MDVLVGLAGPESSLRWLSAVKPGGLVIGVTGGPGADELTAAAESRGVREVAVLVEPDRIGLNGLVRLIDKLGGVNVQVTNPVMDDYYPADLDRANSPYGNYRVAVQDLNSGTFRVLSKGHLDESPSFAPNGSTLMYSEREGSRGQLGGSKAAHQQDVGRLDQLLGEVGKDQRPGERKRRAQLGEPRDPASIGCDVGRGIHHVIFGRSAATRQSGRRSNVDCIAALAMTFLLG